jgi:dihydroorotate dehydrogenase electron transfer subunit
LSAYPIAANQLRTVRVLSVRDETPTIKSFTFRDRLVAKASPGQFVMIWIPRADEVPMSLSTIDSKEGAVAITVEKIGEATSKLHRMKVGDVVGMRGPFGNGYTLTKARNVMIVGGGTGLASLAPLTEEIVKQKGRRVTFLLGAKTFGELLFLERMKTVLAKMNHRIVVTTEDGSYGIKGLVTEPAERLLAEEKFDMIYTCGPELMMYKMFSLAEQFKVPFQASLERLMRCAIGLCGTCVIGRYRVCRDGPVFSETQLREVKDEFGHFRRSFNSRRIVI